MDHSSLDQKQPYKLPISRRSFFALLASSIASLVAACRRATVTIKDTPTAIPTSPRTRVTTGQPSATSPVLPTLSHTPVPPTDTPSATATTTPLPPTYTAVPSTPTAPPVPTFTPTPVPSRADLMACWPSIGTSRVVMVRHEGVWVGDEPDPAIALEMLDAGLTTLTDIADVPVIWQTLFDPSERVLLKVNCIARGGPSQPAVAYAVAQRLQEAGLTAENILIFDRTDAELELAGYILNDGQPGVQCHGTRGRGTEITLSMARIRFFQELDSCDAIINLPIPKQHSGAGISASLKNHYGSVNSPGALHSNWCDPAIAELNAQLNIKNKTRLVVGTALNVSPRDWERPEQENALLLSFDPVALDTVARDIIVRHRQALNLDSGFIIDGSRHLATAQSLGIGATIASLIDLHEVTLG